MRFLAKLSVTLKPTINDPQGLAVHDALRTLGFESVESVRVGKYIELQLQAVSRKAAQTEVARMCQKLLTNPVIESYHLDVRESVAETEQPPE
jgi:phosphoribosylformylglycinamidine synthase PurS subunit